MTCSKENEMKLKILRNRDRLQLSYELPHRTFTTKSYPTQSPNGSSILLYGHESGVRVIWYGGRSFKPAPAKDTAPKVNGTQKDTSMVIDLDSDDDDVPVAQSHLQRAEFENAEVEIDPSRPFRKVLRYIDIPLAVAVFHLAVPSGSSVAAASESEESLSFLTDRIVFAAACSDNSVQMVSLPSRPPPSEAVQPSSWDLQISKIHGLNSHQDFISAVAITFTAESIATADPEEQSKSRSRSDGRWNAPQSKTSPEEIWSVLIASTSTTGSGLLLIHQMPITDGKCAANETNDLVPIQRQSLRANMSTCILAFNTSPYPSDRHTNLLIGLPTAGCLKIYQVISAATPPRGRRGSAATIDSSTSGSRSIRGTGRTRGKFLITLHSGFVVTGDGDPFPRRKTIIAGAWVLGGRAIMVLLEDGEWGVWDIEATGPSSSPATQNLLQGKTHVAGLQGGSLARFAIHGSVASTSLPAPATNTHASGPAASGQLAPKTPHSRKVRADGIFHGTTAASNGTSRHDNSSHGSICVFELNTQDQVSDQRSPQEAVILSFQGSRLVLPSLLAYWRAESTGKGSLDASATIRPVVLPLIRLEGDADHSLGFLSLVDKVSPLSKFGAMQAAPDFFVATDRRLILSVVPLPESVTEDQEAAQVAARNAFDIPEFSADQYLLTQGELDVDGMDRILNDMANGTGQRTDRSASLSSKKFRARMEEEDDDDVAMNMGTPTPKRQHAAKPRPNFGSSQFGPQKSSTRKFT